MNRTGSFEYNKSRISKGFSRAVKSYDDSAFAQQHIAHEMIRLINECVEADKVSTILEIGSGTGFFSDLLLENFNPDKLILNDISNVYADCYENFPKEKIILNFEDAEKADFQQDIDMIASCSTFQWFEFLEKFFKKTLNWLTDSGILAFSTFGVDNLKEIRAITNRSLRYIPLIELKEILKPDFEILAASEKEIIFKFESPLDVLYHLKSTGVTNISNNKWTKKDLESFCKKYVEQFTEDGAVTLTYNPIWIVAKKRI